MKQALTVFLLFAALAAPASAAASCRIPAGRTVAKGRVAVLISVPTPGGAALYACIRRSGRKVALDDGFSDARVAGRRGGWQRPVRNGRWRVVVHDLRRNEERFVNARVAAHSLVLNTHGSIAWAQALDGSAATPLYANDFDTGGRLLDGGDVDASSVDLVGRRVEWVSGGVVRSAVLR
jgi:hypothetical protein